MRRLRAWCVRAAGVFGKARRERELAEELESHLDMHIADNLRSGMTPQEARRNALIELGGLESTKERYRDRRGIPALETFVQDLRYGLRMLRRSPGFTAVAILTLALGIGANTAIFSLMDAVMLRKLPVRDPAELVLLQWTTRKPAVWEGGYSSFGGCDTESLGEASAGCSFSYPAFELFRSKAQSLNGIFGFGGVGQVRAAIHGETAPANAALITGEFFSTLGVAVPLGRALDSRDDQPGAEAAAVLSHAFWQSRFGGDPAVLGKTLPLNGVPFTIAGVTDREFFGLQTVSVPDLWVSVHGAARLGPGWRRLLDGQSAWIFAIGRLKPGLARESARAELEVLFRQSLAADPGHGFKPGAQPGIALASAARGLAGLRLRYSRPLQVLMGIVSLVLLIACANTANLLLARASARRKEMAVRLAIGGGQARLIRQLLTESLLLGVLGGAAGLLLASWASRALAAVIISGEVGGTWIDVSPNPLLFGFTAAIGGIAVALFGLAPALACTAVDPATALKSGSGGGTATGGHRLGRTLVAAEAAIAMVLLIAGGLFLRTLVNLQTLDPGFRKDRHSCRGLARRVRDVAVASRRCSGRALGCVVQRSAAHRESRDVYGPVGPRQRTGARTRG